MVPSRSSHLTYLDMPHPLVLLIGIAVPGCLLILSLKGMVPPIPTVAFIGIFIIAMTTLRRRSVQHERKRRLQRTAALRDHSVLHLAD